MASPPPLDWLLPSADIRSGTTPLLVMAGLVPAIHVLLHKRKKDVDARDKPGHDELYWHDGLTIMTNSPLDAFSGRP
jgi:hypothetical protein